MVTDERRAQNREATARLRETRRASGMREIIVWATPGQAAIIKGIAAQLPAEDPATDLSAADRDTWRRSALATWNGKAGAPKHNLEAVRQVLQEASHDDLRWSWKWVARLAGIERETPNEAELCEAVRYLHRRGWATQEIGAAFIRW